MLKNNPRIVTNGIAGVWDPLMPNTATAATKLYDAAGSTDGTMYAGTCLDFDGTDDYVEIAASYEPGNGNWALSMWINADAWSSYTLMGNTSGGPSASRYYISTAGKISFSNYDGSWQHAHGNTVLSLSTWYFCTWVNYAGSSSTNGTMKMFVNGVADSSAVNSYTTNGGRLNSIGQNTASYFNGRIADVRFYNIALSNANVKELYDDSKVIIPTKNDASGGFADQTNLKRWWTFAEGAGIICYDALGYTKYATMNNMDPGTDWLTDQTGCPQLVEGYNRPMTFGGRYTTGTATQTSYNITGVGTAWTPAMVGRDFVFSTSGSSGTILEVTSATALGVDISKTVTPAESYVIGGTDYVAIGTTNPMQFIWSDNFSLSAWIWAENVTGFKHIIGKTYGNYRFAQNGGNISLRLDTNVVLCEASGLSAKKWHHVVATYATNSPSAGGTAGLYLDGVFKGSCANSSLDWTATGGTFQIGNSPGENYWFEGIINECIAYNKTLSLAEVQLLAATDPNGGPLPPNPMTLSDSGNVVGYWRNDGNVTWTDRSSNSNNGTVVGTPDDLLFKQGYNGQKSTSTGRDNQGFPLLYENNGAVGFNGVAHNNGSGEYISLGTCPTVLEMAQTSETTILAWVKLDRQSGNNGIISAFLSTSQPGWSVCCYEASYNKALSMLVSDGADSSGTWLRQYYDGGGGAVPAGKTPEMLVDKWYHVAVTISRVSGTTSVYFSQDGVKNVTPVTNSSEGGSTGWGNGRALIIGRGANGWGDFNGQIASVQIYKTILSDAEILQNYNAQRSRFNV